MKRRILLLFVMASVVTSSQAQKTGKSSKSVQGYAITAADKGGRSWREVRLMDINAGAEVKKIYDSKNDPEVLNARTGKPIAKKEQNASQASTVTITRNINPQKKVVNLDDALSPGHATHTYTRVLVYHNTISSDKPFATNSAAMAYDKKHERLYYTPMSIAQLRYIDLKSGKIYYFEDEEFGVYKGGGDIGNQITRMVIASDGNGYALTNNANHLIRFTTGKKPEITDLGELTDDGAGKISVHSTSGYGGDIIADASGNLYLISANRNVFKINIKSMSASYTGTIKGLPRGFSTNGAMVEEGSKVIIASSESTVGYYRFDLNTFESERVSPEGEVFNASDLANGVLAFDKKKKDKNEEPEEVKPENKPEVTETSKNGLTEQLVQMPKGTISVYPNPVINGYVMLAFSEQLAGKYQVQLLDISGKLLGTKEVNISSESQIEEFRFPELNVKGNYLVRITSEANHVNKTHKIVVQ